MNYYAEREYTSDVIDTGMASQVVPWAKTIREVNVKHFLLGTDYGVRSDPTPVEGMRMIVSCLLHLDFTPEEIHTMISVNPARLLGLI
jgi:imidazolonepropionase-like amidohydrolase